MIGGVLETPKGRRQERPGRREDVCLQTKHVAGSCQGCARSVGDLAHVADYKNEGLRILCGQCCPCAAAEDYQTGPDAGQRMNP